MHFIFFLSVFHSFTSGSTILSSVPLLLARRTLSLSLFSFSFSFSLLCTSAMFFNLTLRLLQIVFEFPQSSTQSHMLAAPIFLFVDGLTEYRMPMHVLWSVRQRPSAIYSPIYLFLHTMIVCFSHIANDLFCAISINVWSHFPHTFLCKTTP